MIQKLALTLLTLTLLLQIVHAQTPSQKLESIFSDYELIQLDPEAINRQVRDFGEPLELQFDGTTFVFDLDPRDLRSPRYRAEATGADGLRRHVQPSPVHTFRGRVVGQEHIQGRFTITEDSFDGVIFTPGDWRYIEPARNYLSDSEKNSMVVYKHSDIQHDQEFSCGVASSLHHRLKRGVGNVKNQVEMDTTTYYTSEIATEADYEYVQTLGGAQEANSEILSILNKVEGVYEEELRLSLEVVYQHAWTTELDPYTSTEARGLLDEFKEHWNANFFSEGYEVAHLWSAKTELGSSGIAWVGTVCRNRFLSYGLSTIRFTKEADFNLAAHEIGHNFGADHPDEEVPPITACEGTIMQGDWDPPPSLNFCQFSKDEIRTHVSSYNSCLAEYDPITFYPPSELSAVAVNSTQIRLTWKDNSSDEQSFVIYRRTADQDWGWLATIASGRTDVLRR